MLNYGLDAHVIETVDQFDMFAIQQILLMGDDSNVATGGNYMSISLHLILKLASRDLEGSQRLMLLFTWMVENIG